MIIILITKLIHILDKNSVCHMTSSEITLIDEINDILMWGC
jgi:hypothetical protein